jgi:hypothetical protein
MDSTGFLVANEKARVMLLRSADFIALRGRGHDLVTGATLTCASELPWQMQIKCARCHGVFWFDNLAWRVGGADQWRLNQESRIHAAVGCAAAPASAGEFLAITDRRISQHRVRA